MKIYLLNAFSVLLYAVVDYTIRILRNSTSLRQRRTQSPGGASALLFTLLMVQETLFLGTRTASVGVDTSRYVYVFENIFRYEFRYEKGFILFVKLLRNLTTDENLFLFIAAAISLLPIGFVIYRLSKMPYLSWLVYICMFYFSFTFSGMRQAIAMSLTFLAFYFICREKKIVAILLICVAFLFHTSAIIFIAALFLYKHKWKKWEYPVLVAAYLVIFLLRAPIFSLITRFLYEEYELVDTQAYTWMTINLGLFALLLFLGNFVKQDKLVQYALTLMSVGSAFYLLSSVGTNVLRAANYFSVYVTLALPGALKAVPKKIRPFIIIAGVGVLLVFYFIHLQNNPYSIIPYHSVLF